MTGHKAKQRAAQLASMVVLSAVLGACNLFPMAPGQPGVESVDPENGATDVALNTTIEAVLNLPDGKINVTTLTDSSVSLTAAGGQPVSAIRDLSEDGSTLIVTPATTLSPNTTYQFKVTPELKTVGGSALARFSSSFTTGTDLEVPAGDSNLTPNPSPVIFTAGGETSSDTRTLTLTNNGDSAISVSSLSISGPDAAQFSLAAASPFSLEPEASRSLELSFTPSDLGPHHATLTIQSNDTKEPTLEIPLGGLAVEGQGGAKEPSLQWILDTYSLQIDTGDPEPSTTSIIDGPSDNINSLLGDEVAAQSFVKASTTEDVSVEVLATFGVENEPVLEFGSYLAGSAGSRQKLFEIQPTPTLNAQRLAPEVDGDTDASGNIVFDPGPQPFGFYSFWPSNKFFSQRYVYTENRLNTFPGALPHQVRAYELVNPDGSVEPDAYVLATEEFSSGFDYNDIVVIVRNVIPQGSPPDEGISSLHLSNELGLPYGDSLLLHHIQNTSGNFCGPENPLCDPDFQKWADIEIRDTGTVQLRNLGNSTLQLSLQLADPNLFVLPNGESTLSLAPGESYDLLVQFAPVNLSNKGVYPSSLNVTAGDESTSFELVGIYQRAPEGSRELYLEPLVNGAFNYPIDLGANSQGGLSSAEPDSPLAGDEVRSAYWEAANPGSPVSVTQIAAFHSCCKFGDTFELFAKGNPQTPFIGMRQDGANSQTIYPHKQGSEELAQLSVNTNTPFEIRVAGYSTDPSLGKGNGNLGARLWPLKDRDGNVIANTYLVAQDYVESGCGTSERANCDFNDNLFVIENIAPAE